MREPHTFNEACENLRIALRQLVLDVADALLPGFMLCKVGRHAWVEWVPGKEDDAHRCKHCLRWRSGRAPRR